MAEQLVVRGAREHNLKNVSLELPRNALVVFTGLSGSGKSSLAFDTIFAEGQRRYVESLSAYARQFLGQMDKPDVDFIEGLSPAVSIDQKSTNRNPRSTVGTITEVYDYLRLLFARAGRPHCPNCGKEVTRQTPQAIVDQILDLPAGTKFQVLAKPGSIKPHTQFQSEVYVLSKDEGGRHTPFFKGYRPQFYFRTTDVTGSITLPEGVEMVMPGDNVQMTVELIHPIAMDEGLRFAIREGGRTVGAGVVAKIIK